MGCIGVYRVYRVSGVKVSEFRLSESRAQGWGFRFGLMSAKATLFRTQRALRSVRAEALTYESSPKSEYPFLLDS